MMEMTPIMSLLMVAFMVAGIAALAAAAIFLIRRSRPDR